MPHKWRGIKQFLSWMRENLLSLEPWCQGVFHSNFIGRKPPEQYGCDYVPVQNMVKQHTPSNTTEIQERQMVSCILERKIKWFYPQIIIQPQCYDLQWKQKLYLPNTCTCQTHAPHMSRDVTPNSHMLIGLLSHSCASASSTGDSELQCSVSTHKFDLNYVDWIGY